MHKPSLSLSAYLALNRRGTAPDVSRWPEPVDPVLWLHAPRSADLCAYRALAERLALHRDDLHIVLTGQPGAAPRGWPVPVTPIALPGESAVEGEVFLRHWRPVFGLWSGNALRPALIHRAAARGCRMALVNAEDAPFPAPSLNWIGDASGAVLTAFSDIFATTEAARRRLARMTLPETRLEATGPLFETPLPLPVDEDQRATLAGHLAGRPLWLAAHVTAAELSTVLLAHRRAGRYAHRLLLALRCDDSVDPGALAAAVAETGLRAAPWTEGRPPEENDQVVILPPEAPLGLWYRLAPTCFLGQSLTPGHGGRSPYDAVTLGSAVIYGPNVGAHLADYSRLAEAGAARIVKDLETLTAAVTTILAPDKAAAMAHAGWQVLSGAAPLVDRIVDAMLDALDAAEAR